MNLAIEIRNVSFDYGQRLALQNISLELAKGERVAILGPNGSGKSTLLKLLSSTLVAGQGEISILGRLIRSYDRRTLSKKIAVVPQETHTSFPYTVAQMVLMGRASHLAPFRLERKRDLEVAEESMLLTETLPLANRYLHELSGGEKQRVILARALAQEAEILLLDEPTTFLDIKHQVHIHELVLELNCKRALTVVAALHDLNLASLYFPKVVLLDNGKIHNLGSPKEVLNQQTIEEVYGVKTQVKLDSSGEKPQILPQKLSM